MFSSSANCARIPPAEALVDPDASVSRSSTTTSSIPSARRCHAVETPITPPPTMTTSFDSTTGQHCHVGSNGVMHAGNEDPQRLVLDWDGTVTEVDGLHMLLEEFGDRDVYRHM